MIIRVQRGDTLHRAHAGEIPNPLAQIVIKMAAAGRRVALREQIKATVTEAEQKEFDAAQLAWLGQIEDITIACVISACTSPTFYDDRDPDAKPEHPNALPLTLTLTQQTIKQIYDFLNTEINRIRLLFRQLQAG